MDSRRSPLDAEHRDLGARMVPFGGWEMPLEYPTGTLTEHRTCRSAAVVFDVSHLGTVVVSGRDAFDLLQRTLTNDLRKIAPGRAQYTHLLDEDASVLDDIIVWWVDENEFHVMPNASNTSRVVQAIGGEDVTATRAILAVQGPVARERLRAVVPAAVDVEHFGVRRFEFAGASCLAAGTGYTGEDGVEISVPLKVAAEMWRAVLAAKVIPAGLGARDTLRLEAGLPLHGHELGPGITPLQAGLGWVVGWDKPTFRGRAALQRERERGVARRLRGLLADGRRPPRAGQVVRMAGDETVGETTSGNFSPILERGIALAFLRADVPEGAAVEIDSRGHTVAARVVRTPFVKRGS